VMAGLLGRVDGEETAEGWLRRSSAPTRSSSTRWRLHCSVSLRQIRHGWSSDYPFRVCASCVGSCREKLLVWLSASHIGNDDTIAVLLLEGLVR
jgi:hypothetical protein